MGSGKAGELGPMRGSWSSLVRWWQRTIWGDTAGALVFTHKGGPELGSQEVMQHDTGHPEQAGLLAQLVVDQAHGGAGCLQPVGGHGFADMLEHKTIFAEEAAPQDNGFGVQEVNKVGQADPQADPDFRFKKIFTLSLE